MRRGSLPYRPGDHYSLCDLCGFRFMASELRENSDGLMVCRDDYEPEHPQEKIRVKRERITVKDPRPEPAPRFLEPGDVTPEDL